MKLDAERDALIAWIVDDLRPNLVLTLGANLSVTPLTFARQVEQLIKATQREVYGRSWAKRPADQWIKGVMCLEHLETNAHYHAALNVPVALVIPMLNGHERWDRIRKGGHYFCDRVQDVEAYARYITKEFDRSERRENMVFFKKDR